MTITIFLLLVKDLNLCQHTIFPMKNVTSLRLHYLSHIKNGVIRKKFTVTIIRR